VTATTATHATRPAVWLCDINDRHRLFEDGDEWDAPEELGAWFDAVRGEDSGGDPELLLDEPLSRDDIDEYGWDGSPVAEWSDGESALWIEVDEVDEVDEVEEAGP